MQSRLFFQLIVQNCAGVNTHGFALCTLEVILRTISWKDKVFVRKVNWRGNLCQSYGLKCGWSFAFLCVKYRKDFMNKLPWAHGVASKVCRNFYFGWFDVTSSSEWLIQFGCHWDKSVLQMFVENGEEPPKKFETCTIKKLYFRLTTVNVCYICFLVCMTPCRKPLLVKHCRKKYIQNLHK